MLVQYHLTLSPRHAQQLYGAEPLILMAYLEEIFQVIMEHLNRLAKEAIKGVGANKLEKAICWVAMLWE